MKWRYDNVLPYNSHRGTWWIVSNHMPMISIYPQCIRLWIDIHRSMIVSLYRDFSICPKLDIYGHHLCSKTCPAVSNNFYSAGLYDTFKQSHGPRKRLFWFCQYRSVLTIFINKHLHCGWVPEKSFIDVFCVTCGEISMIVVGIFA